VLYDSSPPIVVVSSLHVFVVGTHCRRRYPWLLSSFLSPPAVVWFKVANWIKSVGWVDEREMRKTHYTGLPLPGSPWYFSLPNSSVEQETPAHIPLEGAAEVRSGLARALVFGPTSLRRGEGPLSRWMRVAGREFGRRRR
jgi:hypothetical protein